MDGRVIFITEKKRCERSVRLHLRGTKPSCGCIGLRVVMESERYLRPCGSLVRFSSLSRFTFTRGCCRGTVEPPSNGAGIQQVAGAVLATLSSIVSALP